MTSTTTEAQPKSPVEILTITRQIFAASHWIDGSLRQVREIPIEFDDTGSAIEWEIKPAMCSIGAMRYAVYAPLENALDGAWLAAHLDLAENEPRHDERKAVAENYIKALEVLLQEAGRDFGWRDYEDRLAEYTSCNSGETMPIEERISVIEDIVIDWNDNFIFNNEEDRLKIVEGEILPVYDRAIERLKAGA